jgi:hypothetical protein
LHPVCLFLFDRMTRRAIILDVKFVLVAVIATALIACGGAPTTTPTLPPPTIRSTATPEVLPTAIDAFSGTPTSFTRKLGERTQTIRLGVSPDFANRPVLPFYGLSLTDVSFADRLFEAVTYNHFFRWQEADWAARSQVSFHQFKERMSAGEDMSYPAMDTGNGKTNPRVALINPAGDLDILFIPRHDGFVTFPGSQSDPGLSIKNTIKDNGSLIVRVPLVYAQVIMLKQGDAKIQELASTAVILALMQLGIPTDIVAKNDLKALATWWDTQPEQDLHRYQYAYLQELLSDENDNPILRLWDVKPTSQ